MVADMLNSTATISFALKNGTDTANNLSLAFADAFDTVKTSFASHFAPKITISAKVLQEAPDVKIPEDYGAEDAAIYKPTKKIGVVSDLHIGQNIPTNNKFTGANFSAVYKILDEQPNEILSNAASEHKIPSKKTLTKKAKGKTSKKQTVEDKPFVPVTVELPTPTDTKVIRMKSEFKLHVIAFGVVENTYCGLAAAQYQKKADYLSKQDAATALHFFKDYFCPTCLTNHNEMVKLD